MYWNLLIATALLIAIYCLMLFVRQLAICKKIAQDKDSPDISLLFLVKNQQEVIEGLIREAMSRAAGSTEIIAVDLGSSDQSGMILERLSRQFRGLLHLVSISGNTDTTKVHDLCRGGTIFCFDLTDSVNYDLMSKTIHSILMHSRVNLYRTKVIYQKGKHTRFN